MSGKHSERDARICELRRTGRTLEQIGQQFGLTRERVRQITKRAEASPQDGTSAEMVKGGGYLGDEGS